MSSLEALAGWLPYKILFNEDDVLCRWLYVGKELFTEPFFDDSIFKLRRLAVNSKPYQPLSDISMLHEWAAGVDGVMPSALIFHVSRCGSTLVSQALSMSKRNISLSEVPIFDEILRMRFKKPVISIKEMEEALRAAIHLYGSKRTGEEQHLFIKTDSWHLMFHKQLRALYPATPFIVLYRHPGEVLFSQQRQKGMHAVPRLVEPALFGFSEEQMAGCHPDDYMALVLQKYYEVILEMVGQDTNFLLLNYAEGMHTVIQKIAGFTSMAIDAEYQSRIEGRSRYHAKKPSETFKEQYPLKPVIAPNFNSLLSLYAQIEQARLAV